MEYNKNIVYIEELLEKYLEAATTVAEEQELQTYFEQDNVAPHLEEYRVMFRYFLEAKQERYTQNVPLTPLKTKRRYLGWTSVAAVAIIVLGSYVGIKEYEQYEARVAYEQTREAFQLLAQNFNKSKEQMIYLNQFEETKDKILKSNN